MDSYNHNRGIFDRINTWIEESIMVKLASIGFLVLILLIPGSWIESLIRERQSRAQEVMNEVASKWSGVQTLVGPVLVIPYKHYEVINIGKGEKRTEEYVRKAFFLPEKLKIAGNVKPNPLRRGLFDAVVYSTKLDLQASFSECDFKALKIAEQNVLWSDAYLAFGISDLRGISEVPQIQSGARNLPADPSGQIGFSYSRFDGDMREQTSYYDQAPVPPSSLSCGIVTKLDWKERTSFTPNVTTTLSLKGSKMLSFIPVGKTTSVELKGAWTNPSFDGDFLPESRQVDTSGFKASWNILHFNRPFSQQWVEQEQQLSEGGFGVKLLVPVDQYQKSMRTAKYGALIILLTFIALFLVELTQRIRIHPFQYILIGAALTVYYSLLLSISERLGYNVSYAIASTATVVLISLYSTTFLSSARLVYIFSLVLAGFYAFIFVIIQEQDYSLMLGSIGLFIIIATLMFFSRNVKWYKAQPS